MDTLIKAVERFISGDWGEENCSPDSSEKVVCIRGADIENVQGGIYDSIPNRYISSSSLANKKLKVGDIVIEKSGGSPTQSTGRTCYISEYLIKEKKDVVCSNFCAAFSIRETWDYKYIYYYIQNIYNQGNFFNFEGKTSGIRNLLLDTAFKSIPLPPIDKTIQTKLSGILERIDQKISLNTLMNAELEAMAKQLYDYWFVQFDFPDENGKPYKSSGGKMVWNEKLKREIPEGWEVKEIGEIAEIVNGATPLTSDDTNYGNDIIWITPYDLSNQKNKFIVKGQRSISQKGYDSCSTTLLPKGSVLMSSRAPIGLLAIANTELCTNQGFKSFVPNDMEDTYYLYYYLQTNMPQIEQLGAGTTFKEVSRNTMAQYSMLYVNDRCLYKTWSDKIKPIFNMQTSLEKEINHLTHLRDSLLPMLMNGQVTIE